MKKFLDSYGRKPIIKMLIKYSKAALVRNKKNKIKITNFQLKRKPHKPKHLIGFAF